MRKIAMLVTVLFSLALFGCPDKNAQPDPSKTAPSAAGSAHPAGSAGAAGSAKGGW